MGIQAFDKDGNRIPFAIYEDDYTVVVPDQPIPHQYVEVRFGSINANGVFLDVVDNLGKLIGKVMTFEEVFENEHWTVTSVHYPLDRDFTIGQQVRDPLGLMNSLRQIDAEIKALNEESYGTTNRERYDAIPVLVRALERRRDVRRFQVELSVWSAYGVRPSAFGGLGIS